jgi:hypothetical protein
MKATINSASGLMVESQCDEASDAALIANAAALGYANVEIRSVTEAELAVLIEARVPLAELTTNAIARTYHDVDTLYAIAIGNRGPEYSQAETDARAYKAASYSGAVSPYISEWALAKGVTNQQSADSIIARADALQTAKLAMRNQRFASQKAMQDATDKAQLDAAVATWEFFIASLRTALGL